MTTTTNKNNLRNHANRNICHILDRLGIKYYDRGDGLIQATCPCSQHGGDRDNDTAFSWRKDIGRWVCWSHHCEDSRGNDIFGLVSSIKKTNFGETMTLISSILKNKDVDITEDCEFQKTKKPELHTHEALSEDQLKFLMPDPQYLLNRGFDINILRQYQVGLWSKKGTYMYDRVVFPIRDHEGFLVGYTGRTIHPKEYFEKRGLKYAKWIHGRHYHLYPNRGDLFTSSILFNLNNAKKYTLYHQEVILIEGPLDGMKLSEAGIHNWVATLGTKFGPVHRSLLVKHGVTRIYVAYDNDLAGQESFDKIESVCGDLFEIIKIELPEGKDCGDLQCEQLQDIFKEVKC